jgi:hypothetical protein
MIDRVKRWLKIQEEDPGVLDPTVLLARLQIFYYPQNVNLTTQSFFETCLAGIY